MFVAAIPVWSQLIEGIAYILKFLYQITGDFGLAIILLTVLMRLLIFPLTYKQTKSMIAMQRLMPQMKEIQKKYKDDREKQGQEMMALYKEHKVSPFSSCLPMLLQLPIMFAVFEVLRSLTFNVTSKTKPSDIPQILKIISVSKDTFMFLGMDLRHAGSALWKSGDYVQIIILIILTLVTGFISSAMMMTDDKQSQMMMKVMPLMFGIFAWILPAGVSIYIITTNILTIIQQYFQLEREGYFDEKKAIRYKTGEPLSWMEKISFKTTDYGSKVLIALKLKPEPQKKSKKTATGKAKATNSKPASGKIQGKKNGTASTQTEKKKEAVSADKKKLKADESEKKQSEKKPQQKPSSSETKKKYPAKKKK